MENADLIVASLLKRERVCYCYPNIVRHFFPICDINFKSKRRGRIMGGAAIQTTSRSLVTVVLTKSGCIFVNFDIKCVIGHITMS